MGVVDLFPEPPVEVYVRLAILQRPPVHVWRRDGMTLLTCDPRATRMQITARSVELLEDEEIAVVRRGYGLPPIDERAPDWITEDAPAFLYVPPTLRLHGAPAIQGGRVLPQRRRLGLLEEEWAAWRQELAESALRGA